MESIEINIEMFTVHTHSLLHTLLEWSQYLVGKWICFPTADSELEDSVVVAEDGSSSGHSSLAERATKSHLIVWQVATA